MQTAIARSNLVSWVYPRVCGETHRRTFLLAWLSHGEVYPRVCGETVHHLSVKPIVTDSTRSIPACAGKPRAESRIETTQISVYPRVCGETGASCAILKAPVYPRVCGETPSRPREWKSTRVYPRVCGETMVVSESPPLDGSIPACAGKP